MSIVVPTYRNPGPLHSTLRSLCQIDYPAEDYEIVVVDDGSDRDTAAVVKRFRDGPPEVSYVAIAHGGAAHARNCGARLATGKVLIFIDDDMLLPASLVQLHLKALAKHAPAIVSGYRRFAPDLEALLRETPFGRFRLVVEPRQEWGEGHDKRPHRGPIDCESHPDGVTANNLAVRRDDFFRIGGFDEDFPHAGYEDQEFALRARRAGFSCLINYGLVAWHNDRRVTLRDFGERNRRGAKTAVLLASKYPGIYRERALFRENEPISSRDPLRLRMKKMLKVVLASPPGMTGLFAAITCLERMAPRTRILPRVYTVVTGLYLFRGVREGIAQYSL